MIKTENASNPSICNNVRRIPTTGTLVALHGAERYRMFDRRQIYISAAVLAIFELAVAVLYAGAR